jgi:hypothetical protein
MTILPVDPQSSLLVRGAAQAILLAHIGGGTVGMLSGAAALTVRKGGKWHRWTGNVFFVSMLVMAGIGAVVSPFLADRVSSVAGCMTFYLVATAWLTVRRKDGRAGVPEIAGLIVALGIVAAGAIFIAMAAQSPTGTVDAQPPQAFYVFTLVGSIAAVSDLKVLLKGGIAGPARIARHLWRMCTALTVATGSFFLGQQKFLPTALHGSPLLFVPVVLPLAVMAFWLVRVRLPKRRAAALAA